MSESLHQIDRIDDVSRRLADVLPGAVPSLGRLILTPRDRQLVEEAIRVTANTVLLVSWTRLVENDAPLQLEQIADVYENEMDWFHAGETVNMLARDELDARFQALDQEDDDEEPPAA